MSVIPKSSDLQIKSCTKYKRSKSHNDTSLQALSVGIMFLVWLYVTDVVLDGNPRGKALNMLKIKKYAGDQFRRCVPAGTP